MERVNLALLRGVCQTPAYAAAECGFFRSRDLDVRIQVASTAWLVPEQMVDGRVDFAVIPWTRVAAASSRDEDLVLICGSGCEEAALVLRAGVTLDDVRSVAVPQEGGPVAAAQVVISAAIQVPNLAACGPGEVHRMAKGLVHSGGGGDAAGQ